LGGAGAFLHFLPDQRLYGSTVQPLLSRLADPLVQHPAPQAVLHLVVGEGHELERLYLSIRGLLRVLLEPDEALATALDDGIVRAIL